MTRPERPIMNLAVQNEKANPFEYNENWDKYSKFVEDSMNYSMDEISRIKGFVPIGSIFFCNRTDTPEGFHRLDGATSTPSGGIQPFQGLIDDYLLTGKIDYISLTEYAIRLTEQDGNCEVFGYDDSTNTLRFPLVKDDMYIVQALSGGIGYGEESLPNIKGEWQRSATRNVVTGDLLTGAFTVKPQESYPTFGDSVNAYSGGNLVIDASHSNQTYKDGAKVHTTRVKYPLIMCVFNASVSATEAQYSGFVDQLGGKADVDLVNVSPNSGLRRLVKSFSQDANWYKIFQEYQDDGSIKYWCEQGGYYSVFNPIGYKTVTLLVKQTNANYNLIITSQRPDNLAKAATGELGWNTKTISSFTKKTSSLDYELGFDWQACGYCNPPTLGGN